MVNINELILDRVRYATLHDLATDEMTMRLTSIEDGSLQTSAEGQELTDAVGALITTIYRSKRAQFSGNNSLISMDLLAAQYGDKKEVATDEKTINMPVAEILTVANGKVTLKHEPIENTIKYIYKLENKQVASKYTKGTEASASAFAISGSEITVPTDMKAGDKVFVEYEYASKTANKVENRASNFPEAGKLIIYVLFRNICNENEKYAGVIVCPKAKIDPESVELNLTSDSSHPFTFNMMQEYCAEEGDDELFYFAVAEDDEDNE